MEHKNVNTLIRAMERAHKDLGPDMTLRQLLTLLYIARAGTGGTDSATLQKVTNSPQSSISRTLDKLGIRGEGLGLVEVFLDPADHRRRVVRIKDEGTKLVAKVLAAL